MFHPTFRQLKYLVAISKNLHFGKAAKECFVSQSTLSSGIQELEKLLNIKLVERTKRTVYLTPLGNEISKKEESFENGLLEYPQYTKPQIWEEKSVPDVLLSGDHSKIKDWRLSQSEAITRHRRPDLWQKYKKD